jgi:alcohol dehydrogenase (cytochrome c)
MAALLAAALAVALAQLQLDWPTHGFTLENTRHASIAQITPANANQLVKVWQFSTGVHERMETTPIVVGSTMYLTTGPGNNVIALNAQTGKQKWRYNPHIGTAAACCGLINRGVAVANGRVFLATLDGRLIALNAANGKPLWDLYVGHASDGFSETMAPLVWDDTVFIGSSGGEFGIRGSFTAYRASDGKLLWRWYSVGPGWEGNFTESVHGVSLHRDIAREKRDAPRYRDAWKHGGGPIWMTPALDPKTATLYVSTGNPGPSFNGSIRPGDNLYTDCIVALNARSGKMLWYYQQTPHDVWDYDAASPPLLFDTRDASGKRVPAVGEASKTGWLYILDRRNGKVIRLSESIVPTAHIYADPSKDGALEQPGGLGGVIGPLSYDPSRHFAFIVALDRPEYRNQDPSAPTWDVSKGHYEGGAYTPVGYFRDFMVAVNVDTGKIAWRKTLAKGLVGDYGARVVNGSLSVGDLVFAADPDGRFYAFDASTGDTKWQYHLGENERQADSLWARFVDWTHWAKHALLHQAQPPDPVARVDASPVVYAIKGREYIALGGDVTPASEAGGSVMTVFALPKP